MVGDVTFLTGSIEIVDHVGPMWRKLTQHASERSEHFSEHFAERTFQHRKEELQEKARKSAMRIDIARDKGSDEDLGYCIASVDPDHRGEIDSLCVEEAARGRGIGDALLRRAIKWMEEQGATQIVVFTVYGSEDILPFYARYGFRPKMVMLERTE